MRMTVLAALALLLMPLTAGAQDEREPAEALARLFEAPEIEEGWFTSEFLSQVPASQVETIVQGLEEEYGALQAIIGEGQRFTIVLEGAEVPSHIVLDARGRISGLFFEAAITPGTVEEHVEAIAALPGETAVLVLTDGEEAAVHNADAPLAVASAAKLAVLKAVADAVEAAALSWDEVVRLDPAWRSLPTGILDRWPEETPLTIATLANLMISISDNTATDALIHIVGREAVEVLSPRNAPFLTTRELFVLKGAAQEEKRAAWIEGDEEARRALLSEIATIPLPEGGQLTAEPTVEVEWFMTAQELCALMEAVADLPAMHVNPGLAVEENWEGIAFKGGSETGVLNFTTRLEAADGTVHCVTATWNDRDEGLDGQELTASYRGILRALEEGS